MNHLHLDIISMDPVAHIMFLQGSHKPIQVFRLHQHHTLSLEDGVADDIYLVSISYGSDELELFLTGGL